MKKRTGFTLIELMIVMAIAIILITVLAAAISNSGGSSQSSGVINVDTIFIGPTFNESAAFQRAIVNWQNAHPDREIISVLKGADIGGRSIVITSKARGQ